MIDIPLGSLNSKIYEKEGAQYYRIWPIFGQQTSFTFDAPVSEIEVLKSTENVLLLKHRRLKLKMTFRSYVPGLFKLRLAPTYFRLVPMGMYFCEISKSDKDKLYNVFHAS